MKTEKRKSMQYNLLTYPVSRIIFFLPLLYLSVLSNHVFAVNQGKAGDEDPYAKIKNLIRIKIVGSYEDETVIYIDSIASDEYDEQFDALKMLSPNPGVPNIYTKTSVADLSINVLGKFNSDKHVPVELSIKSKGVYTIYITEFVHFDTTCVAYLEDRVKGVFYDLREVKKIQETFNSGIIKDRFFLHYFQPLIISKTEETCNQNDGNIVINNPSAHPWNIILTSTENKYVAEYSNLLGIKSFKGLPDGNFNLTISKSTGYSLEVPLQIKGASDLTLGFTVPEKALPGVSVEFSTPIMGSDVTYCWHFGDGSTEKGASRIVKHVYKTPGIYVVSLCVTDGKCILTYEKNLVVDNNPTSNADLSKAQHTFSVFPNPVADILNLRFEDSFDVTPEKVEIFDACGSLYKSLRADQIGDNGILQMSVQDFMNGTYMVVITGSGKRYVRQIIVAH